MTGDRAHRRAIASGRVQGVFLRDGVRRRAEQSGVAGSARNLPDGSVEVILEGDRRKVEEMLAWLEEGPGSAIVDKIEVDEEEPQGLSGFYIE